MAFATIRYATLRTPLRRSAYRLRKIADPLYVIGISEPNSLRVFLCFKNAHNYAAWRCLRLDVLVPAQYAHPALERSPVESGLAFDLAITDRRPSEHPTGAAGLVRLPQNQIAEPIRAKWRSSNSTPRSPVLKFFSRIQDAATSDAEQSPLGRLHCNCAGLRPAQFVCSRQQRPQ